MRSKKEALERAVTNFDGILQLRPEWVARDFLPPGKRLGLKDDEYHVGERGYICERWLASVTTADNRVGPPGEGLSRLRIEDAPEITLKEATGLLPEVLMGKHYSSAHKGLARLVKVYDFGARIPFHVHQMQKDASLLGRNSKDEAYHFLEDVDLGPHPETFFGIHPYIVAQNKKDLLLSHLQKWDDDLILQHSRAYTNVPGEGFFLPSGILHAPGTALTLELQEDSDVGAFLQALNAGAIISKELLYKDVPPEQRKVRQERAVLDQLDWDSNADPYFYEHHHLVPVPITETSHDGAKEWWVFYNTRKFSGKKIEIEPGAQHTSTEKGVFSMFIWRGAGEVAGTRFEAGNVECDELFVCHDRATRPMTIRNTGRSKMILFKFFGPDINDDSPWIPKYPS